MKTTQGTIESVTKKTKNDGTPYRLATIKSDTYFCWDKSLFSKLKEGQDVKVEYERNESGDDVYRNIQSIGTPSSEPPNSQTTPNTSMSKTDKSIAALKLAIKLKSVYDEEDNYDLQDTAERFINLIEELTAFQE